MNILIITNSHRIDDVRLYGKLAKTLSTKHSVTIIGFKGDESDNAEIQTVKLNDQGLVDNLLELRRVGLAYQPDMVVCVEPLTMLVGKSIRSKTGCRLVYDCHEYFSEAFSEKYSGIVRLIAKRVYSIIENQLVKSFDLILAVNKLIKRRYQRLGISTIVLENYPVSKGVNSDVEKQYDIVYVGGVTQERGIFKLLGATEKLKRIYPEIKTVVVGRINHALHITLQESILKKNLEENFMVVGEVSPSQAKEYIEKSKIGISLFNPNLKRYTKALPLKTLEYLQCGLPVVTNDFNYLKEFFPTSHNCVEYIEYNTQALVVAAQKLLALDTLKYEALSLCAKSFIETNANWALKESELLTNIDLLKPSPKMLFCAYFYPPLGGPAVQRPCKTIKYLTKNGIECDVLTVNDIFYHSTDETLLNECFERNRYATSSLDPMYMVKKVKSQGPTKSSFYFNLPEKSKVGIKRYFPIDDKIGWLLPAVLKGLKVSKFSRYSYIFATMGPYTSGLVGYYISKHRGVPLILDYRDHWTINPYDDNILPLKSLAVLWERRLLKHASHVTVVSEVMKEQLCTRFGSDLKDKISVLYNGWDESDFTTIQEDSKQKDVITFSYIGNFYRNRSPKHFIQAIMKLKKENLLPESVRFRFIGNYFKEAKELLEQEELSTVIELIPQVTHPEAIQSMFDAEVLLLFIASENGEGVITGKLFEYLRAQKPILAMIPEDGEAAKKLRAHGHDNICNMEDQAKIEELILKIIGEDALKHQNFKIPYGYTRREQTENLIKKLTIKV